MEKFKKTGNTTPKEPFTSNTPEYKCKNCGTRISHECFAHRNAVCPSCVEEVKEQERILYEQFGGNKRRMRRFFKKKKK